MNQKDNTHNKKNKPAKLQKWTLIVAVLALIAFLFFSLIPYRNFFDKLFLWLLTQIRLPLTNLILIILLSLIAFLALYLYLRCIFKNSKKHISPQPIKQDDTVIEPEYTPSDNEVEILKLYRGGKKLFNELLITISPFSTDKTNLFFDNLLANNFITKYYETDVMDMIDNTLGSYRYELSHKGRKFLLKNKLLD